MSIVGTRPPLISETNLYEPRHKVRLAIKPGITGMWQVSGRSDITDFEEVVRLDKEYIENWDIGLDIKILLKTVMVVAKKDGSSQFYPLLEMMSCMILQLHLGTNENLYMQMSTIYSEMPMILILSIRLRIIRLMF